MFLVACGVPAIGLLLIVTQGGNQAGAFMGRMAVYVLAAASVVGLWLCFRMLRAIRRDARVFVAAAKPIDVSLSNAGDTVDTV